MSCVSDASPSSSMVTVLDLRTPTSRYRCHRLPPNGFPACLSVWGAGQLIGEPSGVESGGCRLQDPAELEEQTVDTGVRLLWVPRSDAQARPLLIGQRVQHTGHLDEMAFVVAPERIQLQSDQESLQAQVPGPSDIGIDGR